MSTKTKTPKNVQSPEQTLKTEKKPVILSENTTGAKLKKQSDLNLARINANKDYKTSEGSISKMLKNYIEFGSLHLQELNKKHGTNLNAEFIKKCIESGKDGLNTFTQYSTDKEKAQSIKRAEKLGKESPVYTFWLIEGLIGRYCEANKVKGKKD